MEQEIGKNPIELKKAKVFFWAFIDMKRAWNN